ncbi:Na+/H+ antiporter subunit E [Halodurantibacterium flavum]|uniref:Na+/H+ antiporter subunit E n=1 Tax=Halodurantibacterium flavum TaxID=1382802 RepID=A0ABW4S6N1_9RHOB
MSPITDLPTVLLVLRRALLFGAFWFVLAGIAPDAALAAVPVVAAATALSLRFLPPRPFPLLRALGYAPGFLWRSVVGGVDVAWRAFHPALPLDPGWLRLPVRLSPGARVALGAELSLMPGSLVAGSAGGDLLVHTLDRRQDIAAAVRQEAARIATLDQVAK